MVFKAISIKYHFFTLLLSFIGRYLVSLSLREKGYKQTWTDMIPLIHRYNIKKQNRFTVQLLIDYQQKAIAAVFRTNTECRRCSSIMSLQNHHRPPQRLLRQP
jgi:hypothetical protein